MESSFANLEYESRKRRTRREKFLGRIEVLIRWEKLLEKIRPYDHSAGEQNSSKSAKTLRRPMGDRQFQLGQGLKHWVPSSQRWCVASALLILKLY